jgi:hypothetical protein
MTARQQLKRRDWPAAFLSSLGHASWAEQTAAGINFLGGRRQTIIAGGQAARLAGVMRPASSPPPTKHLGDRARRLEDTVSEQLSHMLMKSFQMLHVGMRV